MFAFLDPPEIVLILVVVLVLFGGSQLPKLAKNLGKAQKEFKDGLAEGQKISRGQGSRRDNCRQDGRRLHDDLIRGQPDRLSWRTRRALEDAAPLALAAATPHAVLDALFERVLQALRRRLGSRCRSCGPDRRRRHRWGRTLPAGSCGSCPRPSTAVTVSTSVGFSIRCIVSPCRPRQRRSLVVRPTKPRVTPVAATLRLARYRRLAK